MRWAIEYLVDRGLLVRKRGVGTQVVHAKVQRQVELTSLYDDLAKARRDPHTRVLSFATEPVLRRARARARHPRGNGGRRLRAAPVCRAEPLAIMRNHVPADLLRLAPEDLEEQGLYNLLRANGLNLRIAKQSIGAARHRRGGPGAGRDQGETPLLTMVRAGVRRPGTRG